MPRKNNRSAETGRFVSRAEAKRSPGTTVEETAEGYVSDAMERAGVDVLLRSLDDTSVIRMPYTLVTEIYRAMRRAR